HAPAQTALADAKRQAAASRVRQARSEADAGRLDAAAAHARRAAELDPDNAAAAQAVASAEGRIRPALQPAEALRRQARTHEAAKRWQRAAGALQAAIQANPNHLPCRVALHRCRQTLAHARQLAETGAEHLRQRRLDAAIAALQQAADVWPGHPTAGEKLEQARAQRRRSDALYEEALTLAEDSRWDEALARAREALAIFPTHPQARSFVAGAKQRAAEEYVRRGEARLEKGDLLAAEEHFHNALQYVDLREAHAGLAAAAMRRGDEAEGMELFGNALLWYMDAVDHVRDRAALRKVAQMRSRLAARVAFAVNVRTRAPARDVPCDPRLYDNAVATALARNAPAYVRGRAAAPLRYRADLVIDAFDTRKQRIGSQRRIHEYEDVRNVPNPEIPRLRRRLRDARRELRRLRDAGADADDIRDQKRRIDRIERDLAREPRTVRRRVTVEWPYTVHTYRKRCEVRVELRLEDTAGPRLVARRTLRREVDYKDDVIDNANPRVGLSVDPLELPSDRTACQALLSDLAADTAMAIVREAVQRQVAEVRAEAEARAARKNATGYIEAYCDAAVLLEPIDADGAEAIIDQLLAQGDKRRKVYASWSETPDAEAVAPHDAPDTDTPADARVRTMTVDIAVQSPPQWSRDDTRRRYTLVRRNPDAWRTTLTITGTPERLATLRREQIHAFVLLREADRDAAGTWRSRQAVVILPDGLKLRGEPPTMTFQLHLRDKDWL
ncbi:MAG: hypothetical protein KGY99_05110, partial [Phycisphaerae bacterium]|nr:hypothetical protein [Phycisphaerae bacterium]